MSQKVRKKPEGSTSSFFVSSSAILNLNWGVKFRLSVLLLRRRQNATNSGRCPLDKKVLFLQQHFFINVGMRISRKELFLSFLYQTARVQIPKTGCRL